MKSEMKHRDTGEVLFVHKDERGSMRLALEAAVKKGVVSTPTEN